MRKNLWPGMNKPLRLALLVLLFSFICIIANIQTSYASNSETLGPVAIIPTVRGILPTPKPRVTPTPKPTPTPTATQPPHATPTPVPQATPPTTAASSTMMTPTNVPSATVSPTASTANTAPPALVTTPSTVKLTSPISGTLSLQDTASQNFNALALFFILGVGAPLLLIGGGAVLWFLRRRRTSQIEPVQREVIRASLSTMSSAIQSPLDILQSTSELAPLAQVAGASAASPAPIPPVQPIYTPSRFLPITTTFPVQMFAMNLNDDLLPLQMGSLDLALNATRAIEANGNGQMPLCLASPTALVDTPTSSMPSSPPPPSSTVAV